MNSFRISLLYNNENNIASPAPFGAGPDDWTHFDLVLALGSDLLPVISNPQAEVSAESKLKALRKNPGLYNTARWVVGISGWTNLHASDQDLARWQREPDYGICLQTRSVRALDKFN